MPLYLLRYAMLRLMMISPRHVAAFRHTRGYCYVYIDTLFVFLFRLRYAAWRDADAACRFFAGAFSVITRHATFSLRY